jgi:Right handed beta helix region
MTKTNLISVYFFTAFICCFMFTGCNQVKAPARSYYISPSGSDDNEGSVRNPWRSLERVNRMVLSPGDTILFEGGETFSGTCYLDSLDSGDKDSSVVLGSYGTGMATIDGGEKEGLVIDNTDYFKVSNLILKGSGRKTGNTSDGVLITTADNFKLDNLDVSGFQHSGIHINGSKNAVVTRITAHDNGFAGILVSGRHANDPVLFDNVNLYIGYCRAFNNPGDPTVLKNHSGNGILASSVRGGTIEYCEAFGNGWDMPWNGNGPVGLWIWDCTNFTIQYCISHDNKTNPVAADGGGFDLDGGVSNSIIQYCVSWSNQGPGIGLFEFGAAKKWENNIVRYNISRNDGTLNGGSLSVWKGENGGSMSNCAVYNNTFYNDTAKGISLWITSNIPGFSYMNNIFVYKGSFIGPAQILTTESFTGNCYWNLSLNKSFAGYNSFQKWAVSTGNEKSDGKSTGIYADPMLIDPSGVIRPDTAFFDHNSLSGFYFRPGSPVAGKGVDPGSPFGIENNYSGINRSPVKHDGLFDIGATGFVKK